MKTNIQDSSIAEYDTRFGCQLVGMIPCSDAFGVDLIVDKYQKALAAREKEKQEAHPDLVSERKVLTANLLGDAI